MRLMSSMAYRVWSWGLEFRALVRQWIHGCWASEMVPFCTVNEGSAFG